MRKKIFTLLSASIIMFTVLPACKNIFKEKNETEEREDEENDKYDGPREIEQLEFEKTKDPATGKVPIERLWDAINYTQALKASNNYRSLVGAWQERGPIYDSVGPSNGNGRGGGAGVTGGFSSGRMNGFLVDASDATGNTVFCGGAAGGIWKCTNFMSSTVPPNWIPVNDFLSNMSIVSFAQNPVNKDIIYVATGEPWNNLGAVRGNGIYKSIDHGVTWTQLSSTAGITRSFKVVCDNAGNVYHAIAGSGLRRSNDGGLTWIIITPTGVTSGNCTDIEYSSTGKLHASFGYGGTVVFHRYTSTPSTVTSSTWNTSTGIRLSTTSALRLELATSGDIVYGITCNTSYNVDSCYKSIDGGATFTKMNNATITSAVTNTQGWYDLTLGINPNNGSEIIIGGVDAYKSTNDGQTFSRLTYWTGTGAYVHADHHLMQWFINTETAQNLMLIATDGGIFYSADGGFSFYDKNKGLSIKQFYSCAIHPTTTNYILGGAQDNGSHQFTNPGLSYSIEVTGGDGAFVDIDQDEPQYQFTSYVYNQYRRSTNGGATWSSINLSSSVGSFINPFDYDDVQNIMLCSYGSNVFLRWSNPQTATSVSNAITSSVNLLELGGSVSTIQVSPYTTGRAFFGSSLGRIIKVDNTATTIGTGSVDNDVTLLGQPSSGSVSCIAVGSNDNYLLAVYSNYGVNNLMYSSDGGTTWTAIDGNLPDMPVRWAVFHPSNNNKIVIATEAGVYTTGLVNGASTQWFPSPGFPLVRTDMLKLRKSDNTIVAATHGRGMWSGNILDVLPLRNLTLSGSLEGENKASLSWKATDASNKAKYFVQYSTDGINFNEVAQLPYNATSFKHLLTASTGYYRIMGAEPNSGPIFSNVVALKSTRPAKGLQVKVSPNPMNVSGNITISTNANGNYIWQLCNVQGSILKTGNGTLQSGASINLPVDAAKLSSGIYIIRVVQGNDKVTSSFIKQ